MMRVTGSPSFTVTMPGVYRHCDASSVMVRGCGSGEAPSRTAKTPAVRSTPPTTTARYRRLFIVLASPSPYLASTVSVAAPAGVTLGVSAVDETINLSHIPATACPDTPQTNSYVPGLTASKVNVCFAPLGSPATRSLVVAPENTGVPPGTGSFSAPTGRMATLWGRSLAFVKCTTTCQPTGTVIRSEEHTSELQSPVHLVCRLLLDPPTPALFPLSLHDALPI